jgi:hypothetical protein
LIFTHTNLQVFDELKAKFEGGEKAIYFKFVEQAIQQVPKSQTMNPQPQTLNPAI